MCPLLQSVVAQGSSCRELEPELGEPGWRMPHGGGWDPTTSSLPLTLARALPADGSAPELDKPLGNHCIIYYVPSVPPLTPPSSECHRHQGRNKSLSGTEREKGARAGKRRDEKCPFYDSHNKAGHMIRSKHYSGKREGENGGESAKSSAASLPWKVPRGNYRGVWVTFEGKYPRKRKERDLEASESSLQCLRLPGEMLHTP